MRILVLADIGQRVYHVGDEAIGLEIAKQLHQRGHEPVLLTRDLRATLANDYFPETQAAWAFPLPFSPALSYRTVQWALDKALTYLDQSEAPRDAEYERALFTLVKTVQSCDAVLIGGGGSFNSEYGWLFRERILVSRIAHAAGKPYALTGQSLGPALTEVDRELAAPMFTHARAIGFRDQGSVDLFRQLYPHLQAVRCLDDASFFGCAQMAQADAKQPDASTTAADIVVSLVAAVAPEADKQAELYAPFLSAAAKTSGENILLTPHMSVPRSYTGDEYLDAAIAQRCGDNVYSLHTQSALATLRRVHKSNFVISSRFHGVVFALAQGKPFFPIVRDPYSALRLEGLLDNWGLKGQLLTSERDLRVDTASERFQIIWEKRHDLTQYLQVAGGLLRAYQASWFDAICAALAGKVVGSLPDASSVELPQAPRIVPADISYDLAQMAPAETARISADQQRSEAELQASGRGQEAADNPFRLEDQEAYIRDARRELPEALMQSEEYFVASPDGIISSQEQPLVTIILRTKNRELFLQRALTDISAQSYRRFETIVVNDGGDAANVASVCAAFTNSCNLTVINNKQSKGMEAASNQALQLAQGDLIAIHDDDDTWDESFLRICSKYMMEHPASGAVAVRTEIVYEAIENGKIKETSRSLAWPEIHAISFANLLQFNQAVPISCLYRKSALNAAGGFEARMPVVGDWLMHLYLARHYDFGFIDGYPRAFWHQRPLATGASANSVFAGSSLHWKYDAQARNEVARAELDESDYALALLLAREIGNVQVQLRHELQPQLQEDMHNRLNALHAEIADLRREIGDLHRLADTVRYYSPGETVKRTVKKILRKFGRK